MKKAIIINNNAVEDINGKYYSPTFCPEPNLDMFISSIHYQRLVELWNNPLLHKLNLVRAISIPVELENSITTKWDITILKDDTIDEILSNFEETQLNK